MTPAPIVSLADFLVGRPPREAARLQGAIRRLRLRGEDAPDRARTTEDWQRLLDAEASRPID